MVVVLVRGGPSVTVYPCPSMGGVGGLVVEVVDLEVEVGVEVEKEVLEVLVE